MLRKFRLWGEPVRHLIVSDIHLGNGGAFDIYAGGEALPALLRAEAAPDLHVILNGDAVDFLLNEAPLTLDLAQATRLGAATAAHPETAAVFQALGAVLAAGGAVTVRLGNHDVELAVPEVQAILREATGQPPEIAAKLVFENGDTPGLLDVGGARVLYTHGEQNDHWNKLDYSDLLDRARWASFTYPPGSRLVKRILNPLKKDHQMRFADLLKPDFHGAVMAALAVDATALRAVNPADVAMLAARVFKRSFEANTFADGEVDAMAPMEDIADEAALTDEERELLAGLLNGDASSFADPEAEDNATRKLARGALRAYARAHRSIAGTTGEAYFSLEPDEGEWKEAKRLAKKYNARGIVIGHTHAARWRQDDGVVYANTGTWIGLMRLPSPEANEETWMDFLRTLRANPSLNAALGPSVPVLTRFTGVELAPHPDGGALMSLVEWKDGARIVLGETRIPAN